MNRTALGALCGATLLGASAAATAVTPFETDVGTAIDRGIEWLASFGALNNPSSAGDAHGLPMLALLEKRASGDINDPPRVTRGPEPRTRAAFAPPRPTSWTSPTSLRSTRTATATS